MFKQKWVGVLKITISLLLVLINMDRMFLGKLAGWQNLVLSLSSSSQDLWSRSQRKEQSSALSSNSEEQSQLLSSSASNSQKE